ncbi:MAG: hypothetical protein BGO90_14070 [Legionella sp. 40-6]|nr:MFS transporter [Legionella sp.]OJY15372.1 MAG: hypothetical protein BGO90_14070 [Legionella sp. 40-6]
MRTQQPIAYRSIMGGVIGNLVEWYDWYVYSAFSLYFAPVFFPKNNLTGQLLSTSAIFAVGFLMRPLGSWLLGSYADRHGRKAALLLSVLMMCFGSLIIALTPGYNRIGICAPILLVVARLIQGLSIGGEYGASAAYLSEIAPAHRRGFYSSLQPMTFVVGQLFALSVLMVLQHYFLTTQEIELWGWRIPFFIGAILALVALYMRRDMEETADFSAIKKQKLHTNIKELCKYPRAIATAVGLTIGSTVAFYTYTTYMQKFMVNTMGFSKIDATLISSLSLLGYVFVVPLIGFLSDLIGRRPLVILFGVLGTVGTVPLLTFLSHTQNPFTAFVLIQCALLVLACFTSIGAIVKAELFPAEVRALGLGLPFAITVSIFGGTAEYLALWLKNMGHESWFYWYITGCIATTLMVGFFLYKEQPLATEHEQKDEISSLVLNQS